MNESEEGFNDEKAFVKQLERDFAEFKFLWNRKRFAFRLVNGKITIFLGPPQPFFGLLALHELGHGLLRHQDYKIHVSRIKIECEAWERAKSVLNHYQKRAIHEKELAKILPRWDEDFVQEQMDSYRDWLHTQSKCKRCGLTRYQTLDQKYHCPRCEAFSNSANLS